MSVSRRDFLGAAATSAAGAALARPAAAMPWVTVSERTPPAPAAAARPVVVSSDNGLTADASGKRGIQVAYDLLARGGDPLDAIIAGVNVVELNPEDQSVGLGGLPNEEGVVQLDASCMHGPTKRAGSVACLERIATPSLVAKAIMDHTDHVHLVGADALRFARRMGFAEQELLTEKSREAWLRWKRDPTWPGMWVDTRPRAGTRTGAAFQPAHTYAADGSLAATTGTINMNAVTAGGDVASVTTTSGMAWKIAGRVGDSPIIGAGQYCDNTVGAAGSTGRGEANIKVCGAFLAVEFMRQGMSPESALIKVMERVLAMTESRLLDDRGRPYFDLEFYALHKDGRVAGASAYQGSRYAVADAAGARHVDCAYLFRREERPAPRQAPRR
ncbi:N(4)-(beta-N-acetylglucosaminyl)-L-asparaginase [Roseisolibacter sp. H3M3-2]|uniref:N(4)-(beta-N-acetylglucosaminyl)-L-asparaginase n=1 Tax=Roseisolibacter sp. H3M3-2 TaxID=3031323 RepID=UPI0023DB945F|nr:N(4)-(beta-N-acetylglucosaminyl)-L-asparaginase [Roseisolibacter sp. H3M3-2]MDF1503293.1 N(4)-(beta-N-acetylglucosaminyl)-L-asparaginase [Roseisolibacter sp. H3M3-2]